MPPTPRQIGKQLVQQMVATAVETYSTSGGDMQVEGGEIRVRTNDGARIQVVMDPLEGGDDTESAVAGAWAATVTITRGTESWTFNVPTEWVAETTPDPPAA